MKKITIAIPTVSGREDYLKASLNTCIHQDEDFEILVSDNPGSKAKDVVSSFNDPRIRYVTPPSYLPMNVHWDFVLSKVTGDFVSIIGDDDGLMPGCIRRVIDIASQTKDMPIHHSIANYFWPDYVDHKNRNSTVFFHPTGSGGKIVMSKEFLQQVAKANARYVDGPMVYHNFIPTKLLRDLSIDGKFFRTPYPDVYSSIAIASNTPEFFSTNELLTISGQGSKSNGYAVKNNLDNGFLSEAKKVYKSRFNSVSIQMSLLDSIIEVAEHFNYPELLNKINYSAHFAMSCREAYSFRGRLQIDEYKFSLLRRHLPLVVFHLLTDIAHEIYNRVFSSSYDTPINMVYQKGDFIRMPNETGDIYQASLVLSNLMNRDISNPLI